MNKTIRRGALLLALAVLLAGCTTYTGRASKCVCNWEALDAPFTDGVPTHGVPIHGSSNRGVAV